MSSARPIHGPLAAFDGAPVWLNSEPLTADALSGRVVLVDFWTYSCVNWLRTLPYVRAWAERYRDRGLVVVGAHAPEFGFEHDLDNVRRATSELAVGYPVVIDNDFAIWRSFDNHYWPAVYLVDRDGRVGFRHFGEGAYEETEPAIQQLLGVAEGTVDVDAGGLAEAADWGALGSPETYVGHARGERRSDGSAVGLALNRWTLGGPWSVGDEAAVLEAAGGSIAYRFQARDLNLV
ncbi:MAG TPA: redoxin family protein, partial [Baekduia sp.]|nr:redoxin family protein [Baekduia sp.]